MEDTQQTKSEKITQVIHARILSLTSYKITEKVIKIDLPYHPNNNSSIIFKCMRNLLPGNFT